MVARALLECYGSLLRCSGQFYLYGSQGVLSGCKGIDRVFWVVAKAFLGFIFGVFWLVGWFAVVFCGYSAPREAGSFKF